MLLEGILAISGQPGLYKVISKGKQNVIVESLNTGKRMPAYSTSRISTLEDVAIYSEDEDVPLVDVFINIFDKYGTEINVTNKSSSDELKNFMEDVLPEYDKDRVYVSDIKKVVSWYNQLVDNKVITEDQINKHKENNKDANAEEDKNGE